MATGRYSRVDGRKSSNYCWTITVVVFVAVCLVGIWTLMTSSVAPVQNSDLLSEETMPDVKQKIRENDSMQFQDSNGDVPEETGQGVGYSSNLQELKDSAIQDDQNMPAKDVDNTVEEKHEASNANDSQDQSNSEDQDDKNVIEKDFEGTSQENVDERSVTESSDEKTETENSDEKTQFDEEPKKEDENAGDDKREDLETNAQDGSSTSEVSETAIGAGETNRNEQTESQESSDENKSDSDEVNKNSEEEGNEEKLVSKEGVSQVEEETVEQNQDNSDQNSSGSNTENQEKDQVSNESFPVVGNLEIMNETTTQNGAWSTQAVESQNEKELQQSSISKDQNGYDWKVCNVTAGPDYIPCLDNWQAIKKLTGRHHYEHRERHCPDEAPTCLVPVPEGYKSTLQWPKSREKIWYYNVPHTKLAEVKGHQNWVKVTGEYLTFPGGGTQFKHGALHYIDFIQNSLPDIAWGKRTRVILDVGCGVASFGGYLFDRDVLAMSFAPKDEHEAQVQFALERGIPATLAVMGTMRLPFPSNVFDVVHCARCRVPWHIEGGKLLLELNRVLRPGGYFVWSATPVYQKLPEDVGIWKEMKRLTKSMCWDKMVISKDRLNGVGAVIYRKPTSNECYLKRARNEPPLCKESDDPNAAWNVPLQACMHKVPVDSSERGSKWPEQWPLRLEQPPYWLNSQVGVYGKSGPEDFTSDYKHWKNVVSKSYLNGMGINWPSVRNVMDMKAVYGGFAAALKNLKVWVMNVVPIDAPDTLPIIYERGLFGMYHDWCQSFNTYPRTYDLLHADHLFSTLKKRCNLVGVIAEVDRILRPQGKLIVRDDAETISEVESMAKSLKWEIRMVFSKENDGLLYVEKTSWRPTEKETIMYAIE